MTTRVVSLSLLLACACTGQPISEPLDVDEPLEHELALPAWSLVPDAEALAPRPLDSRTALAGERPQLAVVDWSSDSAEDEVCAFAVEAQGFPAVSLDGATIVEAIAFTPGNADIDQELMELRWLGAEARVDPIYDRGNHEPGEPDACDLAREQVEARVSALQAELDRQAWRQLEQLAVYTPDAYWYESLYLEVRKDAEGNDYVDPNTLPSDRRPVEVTYRKGWFIARVAGIEVLERQAQLQWRQGDEVCDVNPHISALWADRATRRAMVTFNFDNGGCLCDGRDYQAMLELGDALFAAVDRRPWG